MNGNTEAEYCSDYGHCERKKVRNTHTNRLNLQVICDYHFQQRYLFPDVSRSLNRGDPCSIFFSRFYSNGSRQYMTEFRMIRMTEGDINANKLHSRPRTHFACLHTKRALNCVATGIRYVQIHWLYTYFLLGCHAM